jgi:YesN/AraC family two-component response regulator
LNQSFFELLAKYRITAAKELLLGDETGNLTIEEVAEKVGCNSKSAFKTQTGKTPLEFRK